MSRLNESSDQSTGVGDSHAPSAPPFAPPQGQGPAGYPPQPNYPPPPSYPPPVYPPPSYPPQGYPSAQGYTPAQDYPPPGYPMVPDYPQSNYPQTNYPQPIYPQQDFPPQNYPQQGYNDVINNQPSSAPLGPPSSGLQQSPSAHLQYAVEILIFSFVGWAWLAIREYIGQTPVIDAAVIIIVLASAAFNILAALVAGSASNFAPFANAFFSHVVTINVLYIYSLAESLVSSTHHIECFGPVVNGTLSKTYATAFFGGLPLHQAFASVTVAFLFVLLLVACAQARACSPNPVDWFLRGTPHAIAIAIGTHLLAFTFNAPLASKWQAMSYIITGYLVILALAMVDFSWLSEVVSGPRTPTRIVNDQLIQAMIEIITLVVVIALLDTLSLMLFQTVSWPLVVSLCVPLVLNLILLFNKAYDAYLIGRGDLTPLAKYKLQYVQYDSADPSYPTNAPPPQTASAPGPNQPNQPVSSRFHRSAQVSAQRAFQNIQTSSTRIPIQQRRGESAINWGGLLSRPTITTITGPRIAPFIDRKKVH